MAPSTPLDLSSRATDAASVPPSTELLTAFLAASLGDERLLVTDRSPHMSQSTFPVEVVTCEVGGETMRMFCKYQAQASPSGNGHRGGVAYEAFVYEHVLRGLPVKVPQLLGSHHDGTTGETWLALEHIDGSHKVTKSPEPEAMEMACAWLGRFHAAFEHPELAPRKSALNRFGAQFLRQWMDRTMEAAAGWTAVPSWLPELNRRFAEATELLLSATSTVVHGEFYPANVLDGPAGIVPVDWESAAEGPAELDLATLLDGWAARARERCEAAYRLERWPHGAPRDFDQRVAAAGLYVQTRWLGNRDARWGPPPDAGQRFDELFRSAERLGLL